MCRTRPGQTISKTSSRADHSLFDLPAFIVDRLKDSGVEAHSAGHCTYADETGIFPIGVQTHRNERITGARFQPFALSTEDKLAQHFDREEYSWRMRRLLDAMQDNELDVMLLFSQESMYWLTGYDTFGFCFFQAWWSSLMAR